MAATVLTSWALLIWQTLRDQGIDPQPIFKQAQLDSSKLGTGNARYNMERMKDLWQYTEEATKNETIGLEIGARWHVTSFHALGLAWMTSDSLKDGFKRLSRYARLVNNFLSVELTIERPHYRFAFNIKNQEHLAHPVAIDAAHAAVLTMCRGLCGQQFRPLEVRSQRRKCHNQVLFENYFQCSYFSDSLENYWLLDRYDVERNLSTGNPELAHANEVLALNYLTQLDRSDVVAQVSKIIMEQLPAGNLAEMTVANTLNMSQRTMQRNLALENSSFSSLLNETREELAKQYIRNSDVSLNEITYLLGFSEPASFTRAFKRWTGTTPSQYRRQLQIGDNQNKYLAG